MKDRVDTSMGIVSLITEFLVKNQNARKANAKSNPPSLMSVCLFQQNKERRGPREGKCRARTMTSTKANERLK